MVSRSWREGGGASNVFAGRDRGLEEILQRGYDLGTLRTSRIPYDVDPAFMRFKDTS